MLLLQISFKKGSLFTTFQGQSKLKKRCNEDVI